MMWGQPEALELHIHVLITGQKELPCKRDAPGKKGTGFVETKETSNSKEVWKYLLMKMAMTCKER
jgi:hypothetical protein